MPFSSGTFSLYSPGNPVVTGTVVSSAWANNTLTDIATGLSTTILKDGTTTIAANLPMSGFILTGLGAGATAGDSVRYEQVVLNTLLTTQGDMLFASAANTPARLGIGTAFQRIRVNASATAVEWASTAPTIVVFTATGTATWTKPSGCTAVFVEVVGGGGAGSGVGSSSGTTSGGGNGGGGGGYSRKRIVAGSLGATETVTVGGGGAAAGTGATGGTGGTSSFGAQCQATGGAGGAGVATTSVDGNSSTGSLPGAGGVGSGGDVNFAGSYGQPGLTWGASTRALGGAGGASYFGGGGAPVLVNSTSSAGNAGTNYGTGSSGAGNASSQAAVGSTAGAGGIVIVTEYY